MRTLGLALLFIVAVATSSWAQTGIDAGAPRLVISDRAVFSGLASAAAAQQMRSDDSVVNGAVIGAVVGGLALGGFGAWVCYITGEVGDPSCWPAILRIGAIGAGAGAAVGAGVDALHFQSGRIDSRLHAELARSRRVVAIRVRPDGGRLKLAR
jgi:hypothetical protein